MSYRYAAAIRSPRSSSLKAFPTSRAHSTTPMVWSHLSPSGDKSDLACSAAHSRMLLSVVMDAFSFFIVCSGLQILPQADEHTSFDPIELRYFILTIHAAHFDAHLVKTDS